MSDSLSRLLRRYAGLPNILAGKLTPGARVETTIVYGHDLGPIAELSPDPDLVLSPASRSDLAIVGSIGPVDHRELRERRERGDRCYVGFVAGRPAHFSWVQTSGEHHIADAGTWRAVSSGTVCIYNCFTAEWARGRRIYPYTLTAILRDYRAQGYRAAWIYTTVDNAPSQRGIERAGFIESGRLRAVHMGRVTVPVSRDD